MAYSLGGLELGTIKSESFDMQGEVTTLPLPTFGSGETQALDFGGATLTIDLVGELKHETQATLAGYTVALLNLVSGDQQSTTAYVSDILGARNVKILKVGGSYESALSPLLIPYTIKLVEASTVV